MQKDYRVGEIQKLYYEKEQFDTVALIYIHLAKDERDLLYNSIYNLLLPSRGHRHYRAF